MLGGLEGGWCLNGKEDELDANGDAGMFVQDMTSAKKSPPGPLAALGACVSGGDC